MIDSLYILGIHDGHNCGATITRDGAVVASVSEERLSRRKNEVGYPRRAIEDCLAIAGIDAADLDEVTYASLFMHRQEYLTDLEPWYLVGLDDQRKAAEKPKDYEKAIFKIRKQERIDDVRQHLGVAAEKITFVEHHLAHLTAAYYTAPALPADRPVLGLTCDGAGDGIAGSVTVCRGNEFERLATIDRHASLGKIYSRVTMLLGMKPWEHEYKVMGLAPYADPERADTAADALRSLIRLSDDGLSFVQVGELSTNYCYEHLERSFARVRFDTVSLAAQTFTEELLVEWVRGCIAHTGIADIVCGGGVFMNVKANMLIAEMPEVRSLYIMPTAGDESLSIGAALYRYYQTTGRTDRDESTLTHLYFGNAYGRAEEQAAIEKLNGGDITVTETNDIDRNIVDLLASGKIVARCRGRMEWGARALGNRSLLASADDPRVTERLNRSIKQRDFWMPFAPSILDEEAGRYIDDPKGLNPRFMTLAYPARDDTYSDLAAASHPRDKTIRPQLVTADANPGYHRLLQLFERRTGRGVVLNTSFNLHGEPIAYGPDDAVDVFLRSGLTYLALDNYLLSKT